MGGDTGDLFRSSDLEVMSLARCRCATPVCFAALNIYNGWRTRGRNISLHITRR